MINIIHTGPFGVNTAIVDLAEDKVFVVDPACCQFCGDEKAVENFLFTNKKVPVCFILTHGHFDHIPGIKVLKEKYPEVPVLIHKNDSSLIGSTGADLQAEHLMMMGFEQFLPSVSNLPAADGFLENGKCLNEIINCECFSEGLTEKLKEWKIIHTPGHTMGCICLYNDLEKVLISGDTLFYKSWGRTDLGGSESTIHQSLNFLKENIPEDTRVYPGHDRYGFLMSENIDWV